MSEYHLIINKRQQPPISGTEMVEAFRAGMDGRNPIETLPIITGRSSPLN